MPKIVKISTRIAGGILEWVVILLILFAFLIRFSAFQTFLAHRAASFFSKEWNTEVRIDKIDLVFYDRVYLEGVYVEDLHGDTLAYVGQLEVNMDGFPRSLSKINIDRVALDDATVKLIKYQGEEKLNIGFITDYFASDKPKKKRATPLISVNEVVLNNVNFILDMQDKPYLARGMDYSHLEIRHVNLELRNFSNPNNHLVAEIVSLSAREKSGFVLDKLTGKADVSGDSVHVADLRILTPGTKAELPYFTLQTGSYGNFLNFVDSVAFRAKLNPSVVSMEDIVYFAPALWGMDQEVYITAEVSKRIKDLLVSDLHLETGENTVLKGTMRLPDFRNLKAEIMDERIEYLQTSVNDLRAFRLPDKDGRPRYLTLPDELRTLGVIKGRDLRFFGAQEDFTVSADELSTAVGRIQMPYGVQFTYNPQEDLYYFNRSAYSEYDVRIASFDLGTFLGRKEFGQLEGDFFLSGKGLTANTFQLSDIQGELKQFRFLDYTYSNILIERGSLIANVFDGLVKVKDRNLVLVYEGFVEFGKVQHMKFEVDVQRAELDNLNFIARDSSTLSAKLLVDVHGFGMDDFTGSVTLKSIKLKQGLKQFAVNDFVFNANRTKNSDSLTIRSSIVDANIVGKVNFTHFVESFKQQFALVLPSLVSFDRKAVIPVEENFSYNIRIKQAGEIFDVLTPGFSLAPNTVIRGKYNGLSTSFDLNFFTDRVNYNDMSMFDVILRHDVKNDSIRARYDIARFQVNDSLSFSNLSFETGGSNNWLSSELVWGEYNMDVVSLSKKPDWSQAGRLSWNTLVSGPYEYLFRVNEGNFLIKGQNWTITDSTEFLVWPRNIFVKHFTLEHGLQYITIGGCVSDNPEDRLDFFVNDFELADINALFGGNVEISGVLNGRGYISDAFNSFGVFGEMGVDDLTIGQTKLGNVNVNSIFDSEERKLSVFGTLFYRGVESIQFAGDYFTERKEDKLEARILFDRTNIAFVNAFMDPKVISNIRGQLSGTLNVTGDITRPVLNGKVELLNSGAKVELLGVDYTIMGSVVADEDGFYLNNLPITDPEGNTGSLIGAVFHDDYTNWNFDLSFDLENDGLRRDPFEPWKRMPLNKFLALNTQYKEGDPYYGKAYVTGTANIFGYMDNLEITVNARSERGSWINFPMYGQGDIKEDGFITFLTKGDSLVTGIKDKIDFSGVKMNLNFDVRDNTRLKIIFNENLGDEITATGSGNMAIKLDEFDQLSIEGTYRVKEGEYNFVMGPIKKNFYIEEGGTVQWTGDPYAANLNLRTYYLVNANVNEVFNDFISSDRTTVRDVIYCYLDLKESLEKPLITFDLAAPKATEASKATINRIRGDKDELNRQFFSLLLFRKFQPIRGQNANTNNAALEIVSNQINSLLDQVSQDYKLSVKMDADQVTQESSYEFGVSKGFLDDRLILTGSFGVNHYKQGQETGAANNFIGDVNLEYKLNQSGTFRVNVFNESNERTIIQNQNLGLFTQGVGLHYQESFRNIDDFKLVQYVLDVFRRPDNRRFLGRKKNQETPIPEEYLRQNAIPNEEDTNR
jgi:virulence-associated protein VapD